MKNYLLLFAFIFTATICMGQEADKAIGVVINSSNDTPLENVNIVNLNQVIGTTTNKKGVFKITLS